ncbi:MAG: aminoacetone oxidase family FAD-binding enzyme [Oscillospiraceae bacterium]|nr:aminoacetone oxidase family FAD-binding enzyme [Oscillospiraceae bacterium]
MKGRSFDIAIIGAGASGLCAAVAAARCFAREGRSSSGIALLEALPRVGKKLLATGNGRCNLTNSKITEDCYFENGAFALNVMRAADHEAVLAFFSSLGLRTKEDECGRVYPQSNQAASVLDALRFAVEKHGVCVLTETKALSLKTHGNGFFINDSLFAKRVIVAAGGQSARQFGSDGSGFALLRELGVRLRPPFPALTGLLLGKPYPRALKGVRAECEARVCLGERVLAQDTGEVQFNENGVSGIPVMQISRFASMYAGDKSLVLQIDRLPGMAAGELQAYLQARAREYPFLAAEDLMSGLMPKRLASVCVKEAGLSPSSSVSALQQADLERIAACVKGQTYTIEKTAGFDASQVTAGGVDTSEFCPQTLEIKKIKGLYCCGEVVNVDGLCGGFNLQWAWSSGLVSGTAAAQSLLE